MIKKNYIVNFLVDEDSPYYVKNKDYGVLIETSLLDSFGENGSMADCEKLQVNEGSTCSVNKLANTVEMLLNRYKEYQDLSIDYQFVDYIPGKSKNEENVLKWCNDNHKFLVQYITIREKEWDGRNVNVIVSSKWFSSIVSQWKPGTVINTTNHGLGTIDSELFIENGSLCVHAHFSRPDGGEGGVFKCWDLVAQINDDYKQKLVKDSKQKEEIDNYTFWDIVEKINWEWLCKQNGIKPYDKAHEILISLGYDDCRIAEIGSTAKAYRNVLQNAIRDYSQKEFGKRYSFPYIGDDSFWDLTAHIVGLGENVYNDILEHPEKIKEYVDSYNYKENFEYSFSVRGENPNNIDKNHIIDGEEKDVSRNKIKQKNSKWVG